jgi:hypothetical protein
LSAQLSLQTGRFELPRDMTRHYDERQDTPQRHAQSLQILQPDRAAASRSHDAFDCSNAQPGDA